jgi:hypothetical protein
MTEGTAEDWSDPRHTLLKTAEFWLKLEHIYERVMGALKDLNARMVPPKRGPDPDEPYHEGTRDAALLNLISELISRQGSPGSVNNAGRSRLIDAVIVVTLGLTAWTLKETNDNSRAIAVIQCQLVPACADAVAHVGH